ncbi:hypothetical protein [Flavobacterium magnesitis]|uniref:hypothetical protein n=1 Tax=Flavobacterium magnesitis TaxID=3138077 RepID=UPI00358F66D8
MKNNTIKYLVLTTITIILFALYYTYKIKNDGYQDAIIFEKKINEKDNTIKDRETFYQNIILATKRNENLKLAENLRLINIDGDTLLAKDVSFKNKIVLRYSILNCSDCVDEEFNILEKNKSLFSDNLIIMTYHENLRSFIMDWKKLQKMGINNVNLYLLVDNNIGIPLEKENIPYYFYLGNDLSMTNFFIPLREYPHLSNNYLKHTFQNFFN